jgi:hypothetical protein
VDRDTWQAAQDAAAAHGTSRDGDDLNPYPATRRAYPYRSRVRCRDCRRRMTGTTYDNPAGTITYYRCPHNPATPKHAAACPDHPRTVQAPETRLDAIVGAFFADRIFGPGRAALLAAQLPATDAAAARRDQEIAAVQARLKRIEAAQNSCILELEQLPADPADTAAVAMRARIRARLADLHHQREQLDTQLTALARTTPAAADPALLDELPVLGDILPGLPPALKARLFAAFDLEILWNKPGQQATVFAEITENTLQALPAITDPGHDGYHDTSPQTSNDDPAAMGDLTNTNRVGRESHSSNSGTRHGGRNGVFVVVSGGKFGAGRVRPGATGPRRRASRGAGPSRARRGGRGASGGRTAPDGRVAGRPPARGREVGGPGRERSRGRGLLEVRGQQGQVGGR